MNEYEKSLEAKLAAIKDEAEKREAAERELAGLRYTKTDTAESDLTTYVLDELQKMKRAAEGQEIPCSIGEVEGGVTEASVSITFGDFKNKQGQPQIDTVRIQVRAANRAFLIDTFGPVSGLYKGPKMSVRDEIKKDLERTFSLAMDRYLARGLQR